MTEHQAIKILKEEKSWESDDRKIDAFMMAISALGKQTPKKPLARMHSYSEGTCPCCYQPILAKAWEWCSRCGQKLDWSE